MQRYPGRKQGGINPKSSTQDSNFIAQEYHGVPGAVVEYEQSVSVMPHMKVFRCSVDKARGVMKRNTLQGMFPTLFSV